MLQELHRQVKVRNLTTPEPHLDLHLVAGREEADDVLLLELVVVLIDLDPELHFLDLDVPLVLPRLRLPLRLLVEELAGVHDPAHRTGLPHYILVLTGPCMFFKLCQRYYKCR